MYARDASNRANSWAAQRSQAIEKAKQLREERKFNLAKAGEMSVANEMGPNNYGRITSPDVQQRTFQNQMASDYSQRKPATMTYGMTNQYSYQPEEDAMQAKNSLMLLKSKKDQTGYGNASRYSEKEYEKPRGYQASDGYQYMDYNKGTDRRGTQERNYNDNYQADNNNYRRVFKPTFGDQQGYSQGNQANQGYSKGNTYSNANYNYEDRGMYKNDRASPFGGANNEYQSYQAQNYAPTQQYRQQQSLGANTGKYSAQKDPYQQQPASYDDFPSYQSKNIPSRNNKNAMTMDRASPYDNAGYDSQYTSQPKYGQRNAMEDEYPSNKNYYGKAYEPQPLKNTSNNLLQRNKGGYEDINQKPIANKGWQNTNEYEEDDRNTYQTKPKPQSKPQSKPQPQPKPQPQSNARKNQLPPPGPRQNNRGFGGNEEDNRPIRGGNDELPPEYANTGPLEECPYGCGRSFTAEALDKHANICQKVFQSKRKQFNAANQRMTEDQAKIGYENKYNPKKAAAQKKPAPSQKAGGAGGKPKWKAQSEIFRANLKAARGGQLSQKEEVQLAQAAQASADMLVQCHSCGRRFNEVAAERHIPHCESKQGVRNPIKVGKNRRY